jgi:hypothetical protein
MLNHIGANEISEQSYQLEIALLNEEEYNLQDKLERYIKRLIRFTGNLEILIKQLDIQEPIQKQEELKSFRNHDFTKTRESIRRSTDLLERRII